MLLAARLSVSSRSAFALHAAQMGCASLVYRTSLAARLLPHPLHVLSMLPEYTRSRSRWTIERMPAPAPAPRRFGGALAVGAGILLSRIAGLVRVRVIAHYLGQSAATGAFTAALRIPNLLQNLFGEGVLSASFIPVYARLLAEGRDEDASRVARAVGTLLALVATSIALRDVLAAGPLVELLAPGYSGDTRDLTAELVRILFPGVALLVLSA